MRKKKTEYEEDRTWREEIGIKEIENKIIEEIHEKVLKEEVAID